MSDSTEIRLGDHLKLPIMRQGQHYNVEPTSYFDDYSDKPCVVLAMCAERPLTVSPAFARSSMPSPRRNSDYWELFAERNILRRVDKRPRRFLFAPNDRILTKGFRSDELTSRRKTVVTKSGADGKTFEDEWTSQQARETL